MSTEHVRDLLHQKLKLAQENERLRKALRDIKTWCEADGGQDLTWIKQAIDYTLNAVKP